MGRRGWSKGFCWQHASLQNLINPRRKGKHQKKLSTKTPEKLKKVEKLMSYYHEEKAARVAARVADAELQENPQPTVGECGEEHFPER